MPVCSCTSRRCVAMGVLKCGIIAVVGRRSFGRIFHRRTACGFGLQQLIHGTISRTCDYAVTPPGILAALHLTPRISIIVVVRLFYFFYISIEIVLLKEQAPRRHISVPVVWNILSVPLPFFFFPIPFPEMSLIFFREMTSRAYRFFLFAFLLCRLSLLDMAWCLKMVTKGAW